MERVGQYLGPLLDTYLHIYNKHSPENQKDEMISYLMVWHSRDVLAKYLDLYWESDMDLYLDNILQCGSNEDDHNSGMVVNFVVYHLSAMSAK